MSQFIFPPLTASLDSEQVNGGSLPAKQMIIGGYDGSNVRAIKTDAAGELQVDISSSALPSGAATAALQTAGNNLLTTIDADTSSLAGCVSGTEVQVDVVASLPAGTNAIGKLAANSGVDIGDVDVTSVVPGVGATNLGKAIQSAQGATDVGVAALVVRNDTLADLSGADGDYSPLQVNATGALYTTVDSSALPTGAATSALQTAGNNLLTTIDADTSILAGAVASGQMQVDVVASLPAGTNNIGDVDIASALPAGTNNIGDVDIASALPAGTNVIGSVNIVNSMTPVDFLDAGVFDASTGTNIPSTGTGSATLVTLAADCKEIEVIDDIGEYMSLRVGGAVKAYLPLGGGRVKCHLSTGDAVTLFSETGTTINSGKIAMNFLA